MCKSGIQYSDSDSDEDVFHSAEDYYKDRISKNLIDAQSKVAVTLSIGQGLLVMRTPVRDSMRNVIPMQHGEVVIRLEDATVFSVTSFRGNNDLGYVCGMARNAWLNHCGLATTPSQTPPLRSVNSVMPHCHNTIYRSEPGCGVGSSGGTATGTAETDILTLAVRIQAAHQTHRVKTFRVAVGIRNATLRHRMCTSATAWFTQLIDCLDVADYPVPGYVPPGVLTELHLHLWDCTVDYRPLHLPLRSTVTLGNFSVSSNIAAQTNTSTLRFIAEEVALFVSDKLSAKCVDLRRDYVCVMNLGLFELSLRLNDKMCGGAPRVDLRASNNVLHVRTCSDSGRALMQLLNYIANDGDLLPCTAVTSVESVNPVPPKSPEESLVDVESINTLSRSQVERVYSLMEDALEETVKGTTQSVDGRTPMTENRVEVFFFPDESRPTSQTATAETRKGSHECNKKTTAAAAAAATVCDHGAAVESDDADEEFCILGEEAGAGILPRCGVPEIRWLCQEPLRIVDNHFYVPIGKADLLQAPPNFPAPVLKYTLCEMTLIWHMYGGKDFESPQPPPQKHVIINDNARVYNIAHGRYEIDREIDQKYSTFVPFAFLRCFFFFLFVFRSSSL